MEFFEKTFKVPDALDAADISTQRQLAHLAGVSGGHVNHILKTLIARGLVKVAKPQKNSRKVGNVYFLTPKGIRARSRLAD